MSENELETGTEVSEEATVSEPKQSDKQAVQKAKAD